MVSSPAPPFTIQQFQAKWRGSTLKERSASQEHFIDLCRVLGMPTPAEADNTGAFYTFEKGAAKTSGGKGFADVWWEGKFGWEYKGRHADLLAAYRQLLQYREDLGNPPLLVVCDLHRFEIHTNFTGTKKTIHGFTIDDLDQPETLDLLRNVFRDPAALRPGETTAEVTVAAAARFGELAASLTARDHDPGQIAHFLMQLLFCLFAEDIGLLPKSLFTHLLTFGARRPARFEAEVRELLAAMRDGGDFNLQDVPRFNGGLFVVIDPVPLTGPDLAILAEAARLDWGSVEPAIFGTLFERSLDPNQRVQLGAHYTGRADIERVVEPVVMTPLRRRWDEVRANAGKLKAAWETAATPQTQRNRRAEFAACLHGFQQELTEVRILDPACGSGNFLYVALAKLLDLEKEVLVHGAANGLALGYPLVSPAQLAGLEINEYARELAQVAIWIGYLQWRIGNGFSGLPNPILEPLETIRLQDALLDRTDPDHPKEASWPAADYIIGNPPFLGGNRIRQELGDAYLVDLWRVYDQQVPRFADLVCYFFERARDEIADQRAKRAGLLATNSIRGGVNREVLDRIKESGDIFMAWSDEPWILDGAAVRISIVGFDAGEQQERLLNGVPALYINSDLKQSVDLTDARKLDENKDIGFQGDTKGGPFEIDGDMAHALLDRPRNPNGRPNADVVKRWMTGFDVTKRPQDMWIIDFGTNMTSDDAALYEAPFEHVTQAVKPVRAGNAVARTAERWWLHRRPVPPMRQKLAPLTRYVATVRHSKHRLFVWLDGDTIPDSALVVFARQDDYFFGVLHSRAHELWSLRMGTWLGKGNDPRYTPTTCFETFPLPWPPGQEPWRDDRLHAIANAARDLDAKRRAWLDPEGATAAELKKRTLTNLYNARPAWLAQAHAALDRAVWTAYGWDDPDPTSVDDDIILARLLALNLERSGQNMPMADE
ncbi:MAG: class I SAM-dependent DNA methyltransferase [Chloroflexota bacterium]|nr:class I SAM-dependent DNA methyltransferase [Chloroflexota bacterium]